MKKQTNRKRLDKKCLNLWADIIKLPQVCAITGISQSSLSPITFHAHHIVSRRYSAGRYSLDNGLCLSEGAHIIEKADPETFRDNILKVVGGDRLNELKQKYMRTQKISMAQLELICFELKNQHQNRVENG